MKTSTQLLALFCILVTSVQAQIAWDGDTDSDWHTAANWSGNAVPTNSDNVTVDVSTNLRSGWIIDMDSAAPFASLTFDLADVAVRGGGTVDMFGDMTFTSTFTGSNGGAAPTFASITNSTSNLGIRSRGNNSIINNSSATVWFQGGGGTTDSSINFAGLNSGTQVLNFGGSGDFLIGNDVQVAGNLERIWTADGYTGTVTLQNQGNDADDDNWLDPSIDVRVNGGTIKIAESEQIGDSTSFAFGTGSGDSGTLDARGITETAGTLNNFSNAAATLSLLVDGSTSLTFADFNDGGNPRATIDIQGWVEGSSSIVFSSLSNYDWTVADGEAFVALTIGGQTAYMSDLGGGAFAVAVPEPSTYALLAGALALVCVMLRRRS